MRERRATALLPIVALAFGCQSLQSSPHGRVVGDGWDIEWSPNSVLARSIADGHIETICRTTPRDEEGDEEGGYREDCRLVSVVGPVVSFELDYGAWGGVHPSAGFRYQSRALNSKDGGAVIATLFDRAEVLRALLVEPTIISHLRPGSTPETLEELPDLLEGHCLIEFADLLDSFAVVGIAERVAVVRFGLPHGCEANHGAFTKFEIVVPIPDRTSGWFRSARERKTFRMNGEAPP